VLVIWFKNPLWAMHVSVAGCLGYDVLAGVPAVGLKALGFQLLVV
jgi:hypothetical protein